MVNLQSSIDDLQKEYNELYEERESLEKSYQLYQKYEKRKDRKERKIRYQIERNKLNIRINTIKQCIKSLEEEQKQITTLSTKYRIDYKQEINEECLSNVNDKQIELENQLKEQYDAMDNLITQRTLAQEYRNCIFGNSIIAIIAVVIGGLLSLTSLITGMFSGLVTSQLSVSLLIGTFIASSSITTLLMIKHDHIYKSIFQKLGMLGIQKLPPEEQLYKMLNEEEKYNQLKEDLIKSQLALQQHLRLMDYMIDSRHNETENLLYEQNLTTLEQTNNINSVEIESDNKTKVKQ